MYSEKMENLIRMTLADGMLSCQVVFRAMSSPKQW